MTTVAAELHRLARIGNAHPWEWEAVRAIARELAEAGATGRPRRGTCCPLANHLRATTGQQVYATCLEVVIGHPDAPEEAEEIPLEGDLAVLGRFVQSFDTRPDRFRALQAA